MEQLSLSFEPGLAQRYRDLRECFATCVYQRGLGRVASAVDVAPSNLSAMLSGDRNLPTDVVESYMREFSDNTPALYLAARWCQDAQAVQQQALAKLASLAEVIPGLMAAAGLQVAPARRGRA